MPPDFVRLSLNDSLADLCGQFARRTEIECACLIEGGLSFSAFMPESQLHIYRMVQESFTNIEKHSGARRAALTVKIAKAVIDLSENLQFPNNFLIKIIIHVTPHF
jgi:signal transduction histidine kinase